MEKNKPVKVLWDGNIKAAIFANQGQNGPVFNTAYARIYTDGNGQTKEAYSFSGVENLRIAELARKAHDTTNDLRKNYNQRAAQTGQTTTAQAQSAPEANQGQPITTEMFEPPAA
ncbi:MAG: hypothetical protein AAFX54_12825 [Pseudomonadota bacterium]